MYLFEAVLACILLSISGTYSFVPKSVLSIYGVLGSHHGEITKCAINEIAAEYLDKYEPPSRGKRSIPSVPSDILKRTKRKAQLSECTDAGVVKKKCKDKDLRCREYKSVVGKIVDENANTDKVLEHYPQAHFDAETFYEGNMELIAIKQSATKAILDANDYITARQQVGRVMHTLQVRKTLFFTTDTNLRTLHHTLYTQIQRSPK